MAAVTSGDVAMVIEWVRQASLLTVTVGLLVGSYRGWWIWGKDYRKLEQDRDEWKALALQLGGIATRSLAVRRQAFQEESPL